MKRVKTSYQEPADFFPKELRKELKMGEYAEDESEKKKKDENKAFRDFVNKK